MKLMRRASLAAALLAGGLAADGAGAARAAALVRVVVEVVPRGEALSEDAIEAAQDEVIASLPYGAVIVARYRHLPFLALEVDPDLIPAIEGIPAVASVRPDRVWPPA